MNAITQTGSFLPVDTSLIPGWGVDADPANNPTFPMRDISKDDRSPAGLNWPRPAEQPQDVEVLMSIEHNRRPAVFGTSSPPSGLSGVIRRMAFRRSESDWWHWLMLMGADRLNVVEGVVSDLAHLRLPNIPAEMGIKSDWKYNKPGVAKKAAVAAILFGGLALLAARRKGRTQEPDAEAPGNPVGAED
ncbi:hypothetical protein [Sphingomonas sp.]|uniref:hypothetical protein n=1 Tax=Sphingomonas sp. TaxID=28214 RepID=UPI003B3A9548